MKVEIDKHGILYLTPENSLEEFALVNWHNVNERTTKTSIEYGGNLISYYHTHAIVINKY